jgi:hypothetical protein
MSDETQRNRVFLGSFDDAVNLLVVPPEILAKANAKLDAEKQKRELLASAAKTKAMQDARSRGKLKRALAALGFRRGRRVR